MEKTWRTVLCHVLVVMCMQDVAYNSQAAQFYFFVSCVYCI